MNCFADTSFVLSIAGTDVNTKKASSWLAAHNAPVVITALVHFECINRLHKWRLAGMLSSEECQSALLRLDTLLSRRFVVAREVSLRSLSAEARRLINHFSPDIPHGSMDVLHIAAARILRCDTLITFDHNQRSLAKTAEFITAPL
jgi:predicted nucleic acid-binding protein